MLTPKTLCRAFVAKQVCNATCWASDSAWSLMGLLVRTAHIYGLPEDRIDIEDGASPSEKETRRKLWLTILYLDVKGAMAAGMPPLTNADELSSVFQQTPERSGDALQEVLHRALPALGRQSICAGFLLGYVNDVCASATAGCAADGGFGWERWWCCNTAATDHLGYAAQLC